MNQTNSIEQIREEPQERQQTEEQHHPNTITTTTTPPTPTTATINPKKRTKFTFQRIIHQTIMTIMNAAVTIFSVGVGVGLILGDSFPSRNMEEDSNGSGIGIGGGNEVGLRRDSVAGSVYVGDGADGAGVGMGVSHNSLPAQ